MHQAHQFYLNIPQQDFFFFKIDITFSVKLPTEVPELQPKLSSPSPPAMAKTLQEITISAWTQREMWELRIGLDQAQLWWGE